jgi:hypothetical protein
MRRRIPWSLLLGVGVGFLLLRGTRSTRRKGRGGTSGTRPSRARLPREPEVVPSPGPTPVEAGVERPVASAVPDLIPGRSFRGAEPPPAPESPAHSRFEPVVADGPEELDPAAEPSAEVRPHPAEPVPPIVRKHS